MKKLLFITAIIAPILVNAQSDKLGGWAIVNAAINPNNRFSYFVEAQTRSQNVTKDFYYYEIKGGVAYNIKKKFSFLIGMGNYRTYTYPGNYKSPVVSKEFRLWQQLSLTNNIDRLKLEHRYRVEQRWINSDFKNRFRYRLNAVVPINNSTVIPNTVYATASDEVFFTSKSPYFERNRFFAGAGYQVCKLFAFQAGYMLQFDYNKVTNGVRKGFLQTSLLFYLDNNTPKSERRPHTLD